MDFVPSFPIFCRLTTLALVASFGANANAISFLPFDANSMAMGGAGAVTGVGGDRPYLNPAVIAGLQNSHGWDAYLGTRVVDREHFIETFEEIEENFERLQLEKKFRNARNAFSNGDLDTKVLRDLAVTATHVLDEVNKLPDRYIRIAASGGAHALSKHRTFAVGAFISHYQVLSGVVKNDPEDIIRISRLADTAFSLADTIDSSRRVEDLYHRVDWPGIEDRLRESADSSSVDDELLNYEQLEGVRPLLKAIDNYKGYLKTVNEDTPAKELHLRAKQLEILARQVDWDYVEQLIQQSADKWELHDQLRDPKQIPGVVPFLAALQNLRQSLKQLDQHFDLQGMAKFLADESVRENIQEMELDDVDLRNFLRHEIPKEINSRIIYVGAEVTEKALNFSIMPEQLEGFAFGLNVKQQEYSSIAFVQRVDEFELDEYKLDHTRLDYQFWNLDAGFTYAAANYWSFGAVIKNIVSKELKNRFGDTIHVRPIVRAGLTLGTDDALLAIDADLTRNEPLGFDGDKQFISIGSQFRLWGPQMVRLGYQYNTVDRTGLPSIGLGVAFKNGSFNIAATYAEKYPEAGLALQFGMMF